MISKEISDRSLEIHQFKKILLASQYFTYKAVFICLINNKCIVIPKMYTPTRDVVINKYHKTNELWLSYPDGQEGCIKKGKEVAAVYVDGKENFLNYLKES